MAEALAVLSIFCNVLSVAEFSYKILGKGFEIRNSANGTLPANEALEECSKQLIAKNDALQQSLWESLQRPENERDEEDVALNKLAKECSQAARELINQLRRIAVKDSRSRIKSIRSALKTEWNKSKIEAMSQQMKGYQEQMNNRLIFSMSLRQKFIAAQQSEGFEKLILRDDETSQALKHLRLSQRQISDTQGAQHRALVDIVTSQHKEVMRAVNQQVPSSHVEPAVPDSPLELSKDRMIALVTDGEVDSVKDLVLRRPALAVQALDSDERTALHVAARFGNPDLIPVLMKRGASINAQDEAGWTPLHLAVIYENPACVRQLVFRGANVHAMDDEMKQPLDFARYGSESEWILKYGYEKQSTDENGNTALMAFILRRDLEAIMSLLDQGFQHTYQTGEEGRTTPLITAATMGSLNIVDCLLRAGADPSFQSSYGDSPLFAATWTGHKLLVQRLLESGADINSKNHHRFTPLLEATKQGHDAIATYLVQQGADVQAKNDQGYCAIHLACQNACLQTVRAIISKNRLYANMRHKNQWSPLLEASFHGHNEIVALLLDNGADIRLTTGNLDPVLAVAAQGDHHKTIRVLVEKGHANIEAYDSHGKTALIRAINESKYNAARALLELGADPDNGELLKGAWQPLSYAAAQNKNTFVDLLLEFKADPNKLAGGAGPTPLFEAVIRNNIRAVDAMLDAGADPNIVGVDPHHFDGRNYPSVCLAAMKAPKAGLDMLKLLIEKGKADLSKSNSIHKWTALHELGAHSTSISGVQYLLDKGADPFAMGIDDQTGKPATPLDLALRESASKDGRGQIVALLQQAQYKITQQKLKYQAEAGDGWQVLHNNGRNIVNAQR